MVNISLVILQSFSRPSFDSFFFHLHSNLAGNTIKKKTTSTVEINFVCMKIMIILLVLAYNAKSHSTVAKLRTC